MARRKKQVAQRFTGEYSNKQINFLELTLFKLNEKIGMKTNFKETDRNSFIPTNSCHHRRWIYNTPSSQFAKIRRNCLLDSDYFNQTYKLDLS